MNGVLALVSMVRWYVITSDWSVYTMLTSVLGSLILAPAFSWEARLLGLATLAAVLAALLVPSRPLRWAAYAMVSVYWLIAPMLPSSWLA
ncbi:MAG: hypothetical protein HY812_11265 [Planctomycetes bacterium]|nr:hypothetical protein [Planctomycetota bacterium]